MPTVLLVDDDPLQAFARISLLKKKFPDVQRAKDPAEVFCLIEQPEFADRLALIIADLRSPGMGPDEFAAELFARLPDVPVLLLCVPFETMSSGPDQLLVCLPAGASANEVLATAVQLIQKRRLNQFLDAEGALS